MMTPAPVVLLLAAGRSQRFGRDKRLERLSSGATLLEHMLALIAAAGLNAYVVLRNDDDLQQSLDVPVLVASDADAGMGRTIAQAVAQLPADTSGCLILPVDLPLLKAETIAAVASALVKGGIVKPCCEGRSGHPVAFSLQYYERLKSLTGDQGGRQIIADNPDQVIHLDVSDSGIYIDVDTPERLAELGL